MTAPVELDNSALAARAAADRVVKMVVHTVGRVADCMGMVVVDVHKAEPEQW